MANLSDGFIKRVARLLQEEEIDIYVLTLYCLSHEDLDYFKPEDQRRIGEIFRILMEDTKHHAELLKVIVEMGNT